MKPPIYQPKGAAGEYAEWALNLALTCPHRCFYCYCPQMLHVPKEVFFDYKGYRPGIIEATRVQIEREGITGRLIQLSFIGDPYPRGYDNTTTREIIRLLKSTGNRVQILTKNGDSAREDFDLLDGNDWFGVTYAGYGLRDYLYSPDCEPGAGSPVDRIAALIEAHRRGIKTWVSMEPVIDEEDVLCVLRNAKGYIDRYAIGKLNYHPSDIDWATFGRECERTCIERGMSYYIKEDLRNLMRGGETQ